MFGSSGNFVASRGVTGRGARRTKDEEYTIGRSNERLRHENIVNSLPAVRFSLLASLQCSNPPIVERQPLSDSLAPFIFAVLSGGGKIMRSTQSGMAQRILCQVVGIASDTAEGRHARVWATLRVG